VNGALTSVRRAAQYPADGAGHVWRVGAGPSRGGHADDASETPRDVHSASL